MCHFETALIFNDYYFQLKNIYQKIEKKILSNKGKIDLEDYQFNNHVGDNTKNINWTWAINKKSIQLFQTNSKKKLIISLKMNLI